jgi:DNA mismatch repair protein MutS
MITGPNMSGKSAILRQTALMYISTNGKLCARKRSNGYIDKIFTRVETTIYLMGESTLWLK